MGAYVFGNQVFDSWLNKKSDEILGKVDQDKISTQEILILIPVITRVRIVDLTK